MISDAANGRFSMTCQKRPKCDRGSLNGIKHIPGPIPAFTIAADGTNSSGSFSFGSVFAARKMLPFSNSTTGTSAS